MPEILYSSRDGDTQTVQLRSQQTEEDRQGQVAIVLLVDDNTILGARTFTSRDTLGG